MLALTLYSPQIAPIKEIQNKHMTILVTQKIVGVNFVNPSVVFKKPFEAIPVMIASIK